MKFFGREREARELLRIRRLSHENARFTVITGRRRVGKTELVKQVLNDGKDLFVYLLITRQSERTLCGDLQKEVEDAGIPVLGRAERFVDLLKVVVKAAEKRPVTLVVDEFQEFDRINPAVFGDVQGVWDGCQHTAKLNLLVCGSVNRLMNKVFFNKTEPLYGRNTGHLRLAAFEASLVKDILRRTARRLCPEDLWTLWTITGGVARYVQLLMDERAVDRASMLDTVFSPSSSFLDEGKVILAEEFGSEYDVFFSILSEIAAGKNTFGELSNAVGPDVGTYLARLESDYGIISRIVPIFDREKSRNAHYVIEDCFLRFWFRFVFKYRSWIEMGRFAALKSLVNREFPTFAGFSLERYFRWKFVHESSYTRIGGWWDRKGENEIDLVCEDEPAGKIDIFEIKADKSRIDMGLLRKKCEAFLAKNPDRKGEVRTVRGLSLKDM